ncbi:MAG: hypothetical protein P4M09_30845 [Devosia sp.]|nr:hypothetical protein [Devosia sp.]
MNRIAAASSPGTAAPAGKPHRYELFMTDGSLRFRLLFADRGVEPAADRLTFMLNGSRCSRPYRDIASITLNSNALPDSATIGACNIVFRDGERLLVLSANANGLSDGSRNGEFNAFVRDLHRRLLASGAAGSIRFHFGFSRARLRLLTVALVLGSALLLLLPLVLFAITGEPRLLLAMLFGVVLLLPGARLLGPNRPDGYDPERLPDVFA